ncbi:MAG: hypothetical protein HOQ01_05715 [Lysobacter sp.]|nr:hypothetical protein [Lysobacter sp.]
MRARWWFALLMLPVLGHAIAAEPEPSFGLSAHYGEMYAGRTYLDVDIEADLDERRMIEPGLTVKVRAVGACTDGGCATTTKVAAWSDARPLISALRDARRHLANGAEFAYRSDARVCQYGQAFVVTVDHDANRVRLAFGHDEKALVASFDADEVEYFLALVERAQRRLAELKPQFDAFNEASPKKTTFTRCGSAPPAATSVAR